MKVYSHELSELFTHEQSVTEKIRETFKALGFPVGELCPSFDARRTSTKPKLGDIPRDWKTSKIDDLAAVTSGGTPSRKIDKYWKGEVNWLKSQEVRDRFVYSTEEKISKEAMENSSADKLYDPGTVVIALYGATAAEVATLKTTSTMNQALAALQGHKGQCDNPFLFYTLLASKERLLLSTAGAAQQNLYLGTIRQFVVPAPRYDEQLRIGSILSQFDELIENKKRQNEVLEEAAIALFRSWFLNFDHFKDGDFLDTELGKTPEGWKIDRTTRIVEFDPRVSLTEGQEYPFVAMESVSTKSMACEYSFKRFEGSGVKFQGGDTLLARITPSLENGKTAFAWFLDNDQIGFGTTEFIVMRPSDRDFEEFVYLLARTSSFREHAISSMSGSTGRQRVEKEALEAFKIAIPPQPVNQEFHLFC